MPLVVAKPPPDPGTYGRVLRRYDRDASLPIRFSGYDVSVTAKPIEAHGRVAPTLFFPKGKDASAHRATRLGWKDETESFAAHLRGEPDPLGKRPDASPPSTALPETGTKDDAPALGAMPAPDGMESLPAGVRPVRKRSPSNLRG